MNYYYNKMTINNDETEILNQSRYLYRDDTEKSQLITLAFKLLKNEVNFNRPNDDNNIHSINSQLLIMSGIILNNLDLITLSINKYNARVDFPIDNFVNNLLKAFVPSYFSDNSILREFNNRSSSPNSIIETDKF
jgi:hypothetical protein